VANETVTNSRPQGREITLFAQVGARLGACWRRVGVVSGLNGELRAQFDEGAEIFETVWRTRHGSSEPKSTAIPSVRFAVRDDEVFIRVVAVCPLTVALSALLRDLPRSRSDRKHPVTLPGGPRGLRSCWPVG
jgi:hypothetical protein